MNTTTAYFDMHKGPAFPGGYSTCINFASEAEQAAFVGRFPKWVKVKKFSRRTYWDRPGEFWQVGFHVLFGADGTTGAVNESGIKRVRKFVELAADMIEWKVNAKNSYASLADFLAAL